MDRLLRFTIDGSYTPDTLPLERLGEYAMALAKLLGETGSVHLAGLERGSAVVVARVDDTSVHAVSERLHRIRDRSAPIEATKAFKVLDDLLREDEATGSLIGVDGALILPFPGRNRPKPVEHGPFRQDGTLDGQVIRVGGTGDTIPIHLKDGDVLHVGLYASTDVARRIAHLYLGPMVRVHGTGTWFRTGDDNWELRAFKVIEFEVLDEAPLQAVVQQLRAVKGSSWSEEVDPVRTLLDQRHDGGEQR